MIENSPCLGNARISMALGQTYADRYMPEALLLQNTEVEYQTYLMTN